MKNCKETSNNKVFTFTERQSKLTLLNKDEVSSTKVHVDGCAISDNGVKCDYLHLVEDKNLEIYIELKGQDLRQAMKQIERTISILGSKKQQQKLKSYIICSRSPLASTEIQQYDRTFRKHYNCQLIIKSSPFTDSY
ncbi:hypothetical protein LX64_01702 [Chitinophaga skermanii]|uniref:Uncharacterized protein n=2 Tax=Chitinophaga skermanii TaxID=331697 RepID=A0A327QRP7_9BACT|nr:hypothetical protein LX64_01702 [Chitinophaga skermanii]